MLRYALHYGGIQGVATFALFILLYILGFNPLGNASWLGAWIPVLIISKSTRSYRDNELEGFISYGEGFRMGFLTAAAGGLLSALLVFIFCTLVDGTLIDEFKNETLLQLEQVESQIKGLLGEEFFDDIIDSYNKINLQVVVTNDFFNKLLGGLIISLITAAIYKKDKPFIPPSA